MLNFSQMQKLELTNRSLQGVHIGHVIGSNQRYKDNYCQNFNRSTINLKDIVDRIWLIFGCSGQYLKGILLYDYRICKS